MTAEMRRTLARLPYAEKLRRVAELIEFSRRFKAAPVILDIQARPAMLLGSRAIAETETDLS